MPSDVEGFRQGSTAVEIVNYSPAEEEEEERNVKNATTKLELQEQAASNNTETKVTTLDEKVRWQYNYIICLQNNLKACLQ